MINHKESSKPNRWDILILVALVIAALALRVPALMLNAAPDEMKSLYQTEEGLPYLADMDSWYFYRLTEELAESGQAIDGIDSLRGIGETETTVPSLLIYATAAVYRVVSAVSDLSLYAAAFWMCAVLGALTVIPAYFIARRYGGRTAGILAAMLVSSGARLLAQTSPGVFDTDGFNALLPLLTVLFLTAAVRAKKPLAAAGFTVLSVISYYLFTLNWVYAIYMLILMVLFVAIFLPLSFFLRGSGFGEKRQRLGGTLPPVALLAAILFISRETLSSTLGGLFGNMQTVSSSPVTDSFPAYTIIITEMQKGTLFSGNPFLSNESSILNALGGVQCLLLAAAGLIVLVIRSSRRTADRTERRGSLADLLALLFLTLIYMIATYVGYRFVMLLALPVGLLAGIGAAALIHLAASRIRRAGWKAVQNCAACVLVLAMPAAGAVQSGVKRLPQTNAVMADAMTWVKENTSEDAVLVSWWDNGYFYEYASQRRTLYDGGRNWETFIYYTSCALTTSDEDLAAAIIRMMASSETEAHTLLCDLKGSNREAARILLSILTLSKEEALEQLTGDEGLSSDEAEEVVALSHPEADSPVYFLFSSDMLSKAGWYYYFSGWDFEGSGGDTSAASVHAAKTAAQLTAGKSTEFELGESQNGQTIYAIIDVSEDGELNVALEGRSGSDSVTAQSDLLSEIIFTDADGKQAQIAAGSGDYTLVLFTDNGLVRPVLMSNEMADCWYIRLLLGEESSGAFTKVYESEIGDSVVNRLMTLDVSQTQAGSFVIWQVE